MNDLTHRNRTGLPEHERPTATQTLDALLRIEEVLTQLVDKLPAVLKPDQGLGLGRILEDFPDDKPKAAPPAKPTKKGKTW